MTIRELIQHLQNIPDQDIRVYIRKNNTPEVMELKCGPEVIEIVQSEDKRYTAVDTSSYLPKGWTRHVGIVF